MRGMRKTWVAGVLTIGAAISVAACGSSSSGDSASGADSKAATGIALPDSVKQKGALDIATFFNYPPYTVVQAGKLDGIEPKLIRAIAGKLGVQARFHDLKFEAMIPSVVNGRNDLMIGALSDTAERRKQVGFVDIYRSELRGLVRNGNPTTVDVQDLCGRKDGESAGSYQESVLEKISADCVKQGKPKIALLHFTDPGTSFLSVVNGRTEVTVQDPAVAKYTAEQNPKLELLPGMVPSPDNQLSGWIFGKDNAQLRTAFVQAINALVKDGTWQKLMDDAGLGDVAITPPTINTKPAGAGG